MDARKEVVAVVHYFSTQTYINSRAAFLMDCILLQVGSARLELLKESMNEGNCFFEG